MGISAQAKKRAALIAIMIIGVLGSMALYSYAAVSEDDGRTFTLIAKNVQQEELDLGEHGESLGDQFIFSDDLFSEYDKHDKVGSDGGYCVVVRVNDPSQAVCHSVLSLEKGQIVVEGLVDLDDDLKKFTFAITGGTEAYRDASGELEVKLINEDKAELTVHLD
ncbi:MAG: allene oxide cyclase barrel-like domain-containing protein [Actinomycetota bacterium]